MGKDSAREPTLKTPSISSLRRPASSMAYFAASACSCITLLPGTRPTSVSPMPTMATLLLMLMSIDAQNKGAVGREDAAFVVRQGDLGAGDLPGAGLAAHF